MTGPSRKKASNDRRQHWIAGLVLGLSLLAVTILVSITTDKPSTRQDTQGQLQEDGGPKPRIIPLPNSGQAAESPGDRGGWEQLMTLGLILAGVGLVGVLVWRGMRKPSSGRRAWLAAAGRPEAERAAADAAGPGEPAGASEDRAPPVGSAGGSRPG